MILWIEIEELCHICSYRKYLLNPNLQPTDCSITTKMEEARGKGRSRELVCLPYIKDTNWLKGTSINRKIYQFHLRTKTLTAAPYRLQNKCEEICNVPIPRHMVYELVQKTTLHSTLRVFQLKWLYFCHQQNAIYMGHTAISVHSILLQRDRIPRPFVLVIPLCNLFLVTGSGMVKKIITCN